MSIKGIGIDTEEVSRFRKMPFARNQAFYRKIFTKKEIDYCLAKADPAQHFAARFCAKEAAAKATGSSVFKAKDFEVVNAASGAPKMKIKKQGKITLSLSHTKNQAVAIAIWSN